MSAGAIAKQPQRVMGVIPGLDIEKVVKEIKTSTQEKANEKSENKLKSEIRDKFLTEFLLKAGFEKDEIKAIKKGMAKSQEQVENPFSAKIENADSKKKAEAIMDFILGTACNLLNGLSYGLTGIGWNGYQTIRMFSKLNREAKQARLEEVSKYFEEELAPIKGQIEAQLKADQSMLLAEYKKYKNEKNMSGFTNWLTKTYIAGIFKKFNIKDIATKAQEAATKNAEQPDEKLANKPAEQQETASQTESSPTESVDEPTNKQRQEEVRTKEEEKRKAEEPGRKPAEDEASEQGREW